MNNVIFCKKLQIFKDRFLDFIEELFCNKWFIWFMIFFLTLFGSLYYYGILNIFTSGTEANMYGYRRYLLDLTGEKYKPSNCIMYEIAYALAYKITGFNLNTFVLGFAIWHAVLLLVLAILLFRPETSDTIYYLPFFSIIMILLPNRLHMLQAPSLELGCEYEFNAHKEAIIASLFCNLLISFLCVTKNKIIKISITGMLICCIIYTVRAGDSTFLAIFVCPVLCVILLRFIHNKTLSKYVWVFIIFILCIFLFTKINVNSDIHALLWNTNIETQYDGVIYGATSWRSLYYDFSESVNSFIQMIAFIFGLQDFANCTIVSLWSLVYITRWVLMIFSFITVFSVLKSTLNGTQSENNYDIVDEIGAISIILLCVLKLFTHFSYANQDRYFYSIVVYSSLLLTKHFPQIINKCFNVKIDDSKEKKFICLMIGCFLFLLSFKNVWAYKYNETHNVQDCIDYILESGEGYAVAGYHIYARIAAEAEGKVLCFESQEQRNSYLGGDEDPRYIIEYSDPVGDEQRYDEFFERYGTPIETVNFGDMLWVHRLW